MHYSKGLGAFVPNQELDVDSPKIERSLNNRSRKLLAIKMSDEAYLQKWAELNAWIKKREKEQQLEALREQYDYES